jgi:2-oxo-4-hydroxy-4-carboxy-5-ureidoimidazoline decarboxylase
MSYTLTEVNQMDREDFVAAFGSIFEHTPAIAANLWQYRPFATVTDFHQHAIEVMYALSLNEQLALLRAHPDLGSRVKMAEASVREQSGVGLDRLTPDEYDRFQSLNNTYTRKFGFPFIIAVRGHTKESILQAFRERLQNSETEEMARALQEIAQIAWYRLNDAISEI